MTRSQLLEAYEDPRAIKTKIRSRTDAQAYGRVAAALGETLKSLDEDVEPEFRNYAIASYERRLMSLNGAPF